MVYDCIPSNEKVVYDRKTNVSYTIVRQMWCLLSYTIVYDRKTNVSYTVVYDRIRS